VGQGGARWGYRSIIPTIKNTAKHGVKDVEVGMWGKGHPFAQIYNVLQDLCIPFHYSASITVEIDNMS